MKNKSVKRIFAGMLALVLTVSGFVVSTEETKAAETSVVKYKVVDFGEFSTAIENKTALELEGYLFAGWFKYDETNQTGKVISSASDVTNADTIAAKFVRVDMSKLACQLSIDETNGTRGIRFVSIIDSTTYSSVGFNVYGRRYNEVTGQYYEWLMYQYGEERVAESTSVYTGLRAYSDATNYKVKTPADVFGADAEEFKFTTMMLTGIPEAEYSTIVSVRPYWVTKDGTYVEGLGEFNRVNDYEDGIVNVSVNLKQATDIGAGMLQVSYAADKFEYQGADYGRVFEEMEIAKVTDGTIGCLGNVADATNNSANPCHVFVNLRFKKTASNDLGAGEAIFTVTIPQNSFCDIEENFKTVSAPTVKY